MDWTRAALDAATQDLRATLPERAALRAFQGTDRASRRINALLTGGVLPAHHARRARTAVEHLDTLIRRARLPCDLVVFRGVGNVQRLVRGRLPTVVRDGGYLSASLSEDVAREFAVGEQPGVLRIGVRAGARALWVPPIGVEELAYEEEVLIGWNTPLAASSKDVSAGTVVVDCEVIG